MTIKKQLFCFTYAGGNAAFFDRIEKDLPEIKIIKLEYSGHGTRHREPLYKSFQELADDMYSQLKKEYTESDYSMFGYSMGTISLVEVLRRIMENNEISLPDNVFLAAHEPQTKAELSDFTSDELDKWVKNRTIKFGAIPEKLIENKSFWRMYLPLYRADYSIIGEYKFDELRLSTDIPATVFYSETDTPLYGMKMWRKYFTGNIEFHQYEGTHFFIQNHHEEIAEVIRKRMNGRNSYDI